MLDETSHDLNLFATTLISFVPHVFGNKQTLPASANFVCDISFTNDW